MTLRPEQLESHLAAEQSWRLIDQALGRLLGPRYPRRLPKRIRILDGESFAEVLPPELTERRITSASSERSPADLVLSPTMSDVSDVSAVSEKEAEERLRRGLDAVALEGGLLVHAGRRPAHWMGRTLDRLTGGLSRWFHLPDAPWPGHDLWFVTLDPCLLWPADLRDALDLPFGVLEGCERSERGMHLSGWAVGGRRPPRPARLRLRCGEFEVEAETFGPRGDVAALLGGIERDGPASAFELQIDLPIDPESVLCLEAADPASDDRRQLLFQGTIDEATRLVEARRIRWQSGVGAEPPTGRLRHVWQRMVRRLVGRFG